MEIMTQGMPRIDTCKIEKSAKNLWKKLNEDTVEISIVTTPMSIIAATVGVVAVIGIAKCVGKIEKKASIKKEAKKIAKKKALDRAKKIAAAEEAAIENMAN